MTTDPKQVDEAVERSGLSAANRALVETDLPLTGSFDQGGHMLLSESGLNRLLDVARAEALSTLRSQPIDMVLHCPRCGLQHVDEPEVFTSEDYADGYKEPWANPPHRSHLCDACGCIWRPADVPTNGVSAVQTTGKADTPLKSYPTLRSQHEALVGALETCNAVFTAMEDAQVATVPGWYATIGATREIIRKALNPTQPND